MTGNSHLRFRRIAPVYDLALKAIGLPFGGERKVREAVLDLLPRQEGAQVLDIGCGTGTIAMMLAQQVGPEGTVIGVEPCEEMLLRAQRKAAAAGVPQVRFQAGAGAPLPFPDASFDAVIMFLVLHEMAHSDRLDTLRETVRVLRPGGHLLMGELRMPQEWWRRLPMRLLLLMEEKEAGDFLRRGRRNVVAEGAGEWLEQVREKAIAAGFGEATIYRKRS